MVKARVIHRVGHRFDNIGTVFLDRVVDRIFRRFLFPRVINAQSAPQIKGIKGRALAAQFGEIATGFGDRAADIIDIGNLRAKVRMLQRQTMEKTRRPQAINDRDQLICVHAKAGAVAGAFRPVARNFVVEFDPDTQQGFLPQFGHNIQHSIEFARAFQHEDRVKAQLAREDGEADKLPVLHPVTDNQGLWFQPMGQRNHQFGF